MKIVRRHIGALLPKIGPHLGSPDWGPGYMTTPTVPRKSRSCPVEKKLHISAEEAAGVASSGLAITKEILLQVFATDRSAYVRHYSLRLGVPPWSDMSVAAKGIQRLRVSWFTATLQALPD